MNLTDGKLSNYLGQGKDNKKLDSYLVSVDRDLQNLWRVINAIIPFVGANPLTLDTNATTGFSYIPLMATYPIGSPTDYTGHTAMVFCNSDSSLHIFNTSNNNWKLELLT